MFAISFCVRREEGEESKKIRMKMWRKEKGEERKEKLKGKDEEKEGEKRMTGS